MELQTKFVAAEQTQPHALTNSGLDVREPSYARPKSSHFLTDSDLFNHILDSKLIMVGLRFLSHFTTSKDVQTLTKENIMVEEDMDLEDDQEKEEPSKKKKKCNPDKLREESEEWACQAQTYRNEVESVKADMKSELETKEQQIKILQQTLQGMQQQLLDAQKKSGNLPGFLMDSKEKKTQAKSPGKLKDTPEKKQESASEEEKPVDTSVMDASAPSGVKSESKEESSKPKIPLAGEDARLVAVISTFLNVHPFGAGADYIWSYLLRVDPSIQYKEVEQLMEKYDTCFTMEVEGVGANLARKWKLIAFKPE